MAQLPFLLLVNLALGNRPPEFIFRLFTGVVAYLGPDTIMPLATAIAAILGFILIFWRFILKVIKKPFQFIYSKVTGKPIDHVQQADVQEPAQDEKQSL